MPAPVVHFEIGCRDAAKAKKFYGPLFGWEFQDFGPAAMVSPTPPGIGGHINSLGHEPHHYVTFYVQVENLESSLAQVSRLGGKTVVPSTEVPGMGHFAWFSDPDGNVVGLWKPMAG